MLLDIGIEIAETLNSWDQDGISVIGARLPAGILWLLLMGLRLAWTLPIMPGLAIRFRLSEFDFLDCGDLTWNVRVRSFAPKYPRHHRPVPGDASWSGYLEQSCPGAEHPADGGHHQRRFAQGRLAESPSSCCDRFPKAAYRRNAATSPEDNTDPGLIANSDPGGGQFIHVSVTPDGSKFHVQIGLKRPAARVRVPVIFRGNFESKGVQFHDASIPTSRR